MPKGHNSKKPRQSREFQEGETAWYEIAENPIQGLPPVRETAIVGTYADNGAYHITVYDINGTPYQTTVYPDKLKKQT